MIFYLVALILVNISVFLFGISTVVTLALITAFTAAIKAITSEKFSDIYNIHSFRRTLNSNNVLELVGSFFVGVIACQGIHNFNILDFFIFILFSLLVYRFLFFNLSKSFK